MNYCIINIGDQIIGESDFEVIDHSMGAIGGVFIPNQNYNKYQLLVQSHCRNKGISNIDDFDCRITLPDNSILNPEGVIGITDIRGFNEIYIESVGLDKYQVLNFK